jgi:hypothetical protein
MVRVRRCAERPDLKSHLHEYKDAKQTKEDSGNLEKLSYTVECSPVGSQEATECSQKYSITSSSSCCSWLVRKCTISPAVQLWVQLHRYPASPNSGWTMGRVGTTWPVGLSAVPYTATTVHFTTVTRTTNRLSRYGYGLPPYPYRMAVLRVVRPIW